MLDDVSRARKAGIRVAGLVCTRHDHFLDSSVSDCAVYLLRAGQVGPHDADGGLGVGWRGGRMMDGRRAGPGESAQAGEQDGAGQQPIASGLHEFRHAWLAADQDGALVSLWLAM